MGGNDQHGAGREQDDLIDEVSAGLRARAAMTPRSADPFGPVGAAVAADRRRRTIYGASLAAVAVMGVSLTVGRLGLGLGEGAGNARVAQGQQAMLEPGALQGSTTGGPASPPTPATSRRTSSQTSPTTAASSGNVSDRSMPKVPGWPLNYPASSTFTASEPTVNAMITAYGQPVDDGARHVLLNLVDSFHVCGYNLSSYTFKLRWAGDLAHSGGHGAVVVDITRGGATFRMMGYDTYKGVQLDPPFQLTGDEAARFEVADGEFDEPAQTAYEIVTAAPGSKVGVSVQPSSASPPTVTVGPSGVVEVQTYVLTPGGMYQPALVTAIMVTRPDGSTASVPRPSFSEAAEKAARQLLPSSSICPVAQPWK